ncbi:MAG: hypothetical protein QOE18_1652 [Chloroflexota bacterium]|nr:hypothetical protein [Chloroflexota bacterium]
MAALCAIVAVWDLGATLIWGTSGSSKLRFAFAFSTVGASALLACAVVGIIAAAGALRSFAQTTACRQTHRTPRASGWQDDDVAMWVDMAMARL